MQKIVVKEAKKSLKKQDDGQMKLKTLVKAVSDKVGDDKASEKEIKEYIIASSKFTLDGKIVMLKRKRSVDNEGEVDSGISTESNTPKNKVKKSKPSDEGTKSNSSETTSTSTIIENPVKVDAESIAKWRTENKIVIVPPISSDSDDADDHKEKTTNLNKNKELFPLFSFDNAHENQSLSGELLSHCTKVHKFQKPSPIQAQSWPILGSGQDMVGIAETGSGKTLAFSIPILSKMVQSINRSNKKIKRSPSMLILAPTRELAMQSDEVLQDFGAVVNIQSLVIYGGVPKHTQASALKSGNIDCIVATPGRLKDLVNDGVCNLKQIRHLVLDEADRMLDMGFEEDVKYIISNCMNKEKGRQTTMFSATWPAAIQKIANEYMNNPIRVYVGFEAIVGSNGEDGDNNGTTTVDDSLSANRRVKQSVEVIEDRQRDHRLRQLLKEVQGGARKNDRVLIFALYKKEADRLENTLRRDGHNVCSIHGNKAQAARTEALAKFKNGSCPLMVATDVAARGLDIPNVEVVINYTFPLTIEDYVHRIGRTGRAGKTGESYTFFQPTDKSHAGELQQVLKQVGQPIPNDLLKFGSTIKKKEHKVYGNFGPRSADGPMAKPTKITFNYDD
jgi:ATP-dependent RNA helicase DBP3